MAEFVHTQNALADLAANRYLGVGLHRGVTTVASSIGSVIRHAPLNPSEGHMSADIDPMAWEEDIIDIPHVALTTVRNPLQVNVVTHLRNPKSEITNVNDKRNLLARHISEALANARPGRNDQVWQYAVGEAANEGKGPEVEVISTNGNPRKDAKTIADICQEGLTLVISDYLRLPLESQPKSYFPQTVAIKANHPTDLKIMEGVGPVPTGYSDPSRRRGIFRLAGGGEVDTENESEVAEVNASLRRLHKGTIARLRASGIAVATLTLNPESQNGYEERAADMAVARAINEVAER